MLVRRGPLSKFLSRRARTNPVFVRLALFSALERNAT
jgi:hypothetical protein